MEQIKKHLALLGMKVRDKVTGLKGVVTSVSFDLYGCVQVIVVPEVKKDGSKGEASWMDVARLELKKGKPVLAAPDFEMPKEKVKAAVAEGRKGPAEKPVLD